MVLNRLYDFTEFHSVFSTIQWNLSVAGNNDFPKTCLQKRSIHYENVNINKEFQLVFNGFVLYKEMSAKKYVRYKEIQLYLKMFLLLLSHSKKRALNG